jgi:hypothetical protein
VRATRAVQIESNGHNTTREGVRKDLISSTGGWSDDSRAPSLPRLNRYARSDPSRLLWIQRPRRHLPPDGATATGAERGAAARHRWSTARRTRVPNQKTTLCNATLGTRVTTWRASYRHWIGEASQPRHEAADGEGFAPLRNFGVISHSSTLSRPWAPPPRSPVISRLDHVPRTATQARSHGSSFLFLTGPLSLRLRRGAHGMGLALVLERGAVIFIPQSSSTNHPRDSRHWRPWLAPIDKRSVTGEIGEGSMQPIRSR